MFNFRFFTKFQLVMEILAFICFFGVTIYMICTWHTLPDQIPSHYGASGVPDAYGGKGSLIIMYVIMLSTYLLMVLCTFIPGSWNFPVRITGRNAPLAYRYARSLIIMLTLVINVTFCYILIQSMRCASLNPWFLPIDLAAMFIPIICYCIKIARLPG